jgi:hypothetical protein
MSSDSSMSSEAHVELQVFVCVELIVTMPRLDVATAYNPLPNYSGTKISSPSEQSKCSNSTEIDFEALIRDPLTKEIVSKEASATVEPLKSSQERPDIRKSWTESAASVGIGIARTLSYAARKYHTHVKDSNEPNSQKTNQVASSGESVSGNSTQSTTINFSYPLTAPYNRWIHQTNFELLSSDDQPGETKSCSPLSMCGVKTCWYCARMVYGQSLFIWE